MASKQPAAEAATPNEQLQHVLRRAAANALYSDDATAILAMCDAVGKGTASAATAAADVATTRRERDEARAQRDEADKRADAAEQKTAKLQAEHDELRLQYDAARKELEGLKLGNVSGGGDKGGKKS